MPGNTWTRDEYLVTLDLYLNTPGIVVDKSDPTVQETAEMTGRTPSSIALRLSNYRYLDPQGSKGMSHLSEGCREIWEDFYGNEKELAYEADRAKERLHSPKDDSSAGGEKTRINTGDSSTETKSRSGQADFRAALRDRYDDSCLLCDISTPGLLQAGHILPWSEFEELRGDPDNGLLLCYTHHRAFDLQMWTFTESYEVIARPGLANQNPSLEQFLCGNETLEWPDEPPSAKYLKKHNERVPWWPPKNSASSSLSDS
ncbi:HNH endonuclease [Halomarina rubra]|uniref:HNH endonuclease n=1 Tax=Halomarina rubra TaxID=2071873 RepID=A0ABD6AUP7_9EURY|nr:HNH endonuclease signature motif containing protein [Halomarina rubra]